MSTAIPEAPHPHAPESFIQKRLGAFPLWVWALIFAVMLALGFWWKRSRAASASLSNGNVVSGSTVSTSDNLGTETGDGFVSNGGTSSYGSGGGISNTGSSGTTTNAQWGVQAANTLIGQGQDPSTVQSAISAYLSGQPLSTAQQALINSALQQAGTPPQGVVAVATPTPSTSYVVQVGDTITSIAQEFYGDSSKWKEIYAANAEVLKGDPLGGLHHNQTLILPGDGLLAQPGSQSSASTQLMPASHVYTAQYGDNAQQISIKFYGSTSMATAIYNANKSAFKSNGAGGYSAIAGSPIKLP